MPRSLIVADPFQFGGIAAANALSDVYAMGGEPRTALNVTCFPEHGVAMEILGEILRGDIAKASEAGVVVLGGHTMNDEEIKYGMAVTGVVHPERFWRNVGARPGDVLVLTKALGTGIITTACMRGAGTATGQVAAVESMLTLNAVASQVLRDFAVHACTDVTGCCRGAASGRYRGCRDRGHRPGATKRRLGDTALGDCVQFSTLPIHLVTPFDGRA